MSVSTSNGINETSSQADLRRYLESQEERGISPVIQEGTDSITIRRPVSYHSINTPAGREGDDHDAHTRAMVHRYKYYSRLAPHGNDSRLLMPNHIVPSEFFLVIPLKLEGKQSSLVTIFSIWNTMMGTSLLSMPWALEAAGFANGIVIMFVMGGLTLYTAYRVMKSIEGLSPEVQVLEFSDVCRYYLGRWGEYISVVFSLVALLGAAIVYWVLMSNFLYHFVYFIYEKINHESNITQFTPVGNLTHYADVMCPNHPVVHPPHPAVTLLPSNVSVVTTPTPVWSSVSPTGSPNSQSTVFDSVWDQTKTVPFFLILVLGPLINFKSPTFFTKFNALGTVSVVYILSFVVIKASQWGVNLDFNPTHQAMYVPEFQPTFPALTGTLALAFFIHNCVLSIVRNQKHPENNGRDLTIAYVCVGLTYMIVAILFYTCFPLAKACIEDNLLNNIRNSDGLGFGARVFLFFQMVTVFPLIMYIFRVQTMHPLFGRVYPSLKHVVVLNILIVTICLLFARFYPHIGQVIRFSGAFCGLAYIFTLPCLVYMLSLREQGKLTRTNAAFHIFLIVVGVANFVAQFLIMGKI